MAKHITLKRIAILTALISLASFIYKLVIGILATSLVMIISSIPTFFVFVCKALFAKNMNQSRSDKKKTYFIMIIAISFFVTLFVLFSILKVGGIDITNQNRFEGWIGIIFILFIILMFVLSIINLRGALNKTDLLAIGLREMSFVSALTDAVMINEFLYRVIIKYISVPFYDTISRYFPLIVGGIMIIVPIIMIKRFIAYKA